MAERRYLGDKNWCLPCNRPLSECACTAPNTGHVNDRQVGGDHYKSPYQHWDFVIKTGQNYLQGNCTAYITRWRRKDGLKDLEKSLHYIDKMEEAKLQKIPFDTRELFMFARANDLGIYETAAIWAVLAHEWVVARAWIEAIISDVHRADTTRLQPI